MYVKLLILILLCENALAAKILALMVVPSHSHHLWNSKYLEALAQRGHEITYLTVDHYKNPPKNIKVIHIQGVYENLNDTVDLSQLSELGAYEYEYLLGAWEDQVAEILSQSKALAELKETVRKERFDLIVFDIVTCPYLLGVADLAGKPPIMGITPFGVPTQVLQILGNPMTYSTKPHFLTAYSNRMTVFQRANNYFLHMFSFAVRWFFMRKQNEHLKKCFGENVRSVEELLDDINIIMVNSNHGTDYPFPMVPGLIPIAGLHIDEPRPLLQELQLYLDEAKDGVVYFSLGSNLQSSTLTPDKLSVLANAFRELSPVRVLWKFESESLPGKPKNVKISKWLPQNDILAHPNVRVFFTHSGALSTQEAIYHGKPIVAMPFFLDQQSNAGKSVQRGLGEQLKFETITTEEVVRCIRRVLNNPRYTESARNASLLFRDQEVHPRDQAVYWTEYAIRHRGARHFRHSSRDMAWYQVWMLDIAVGILVVLLVFYYLLKSCLTNICGGDRSPKIKKS